VTATPPDHVAGPGSLVLDLLGDIDRTGRKEIRLKTLVALGEQLGISAPTMRVTLNRLRERGWFDVRRDGRESTYHLQPECLRALGEGKRRIFRDPTATWRGEWSMVIYTVPESDRQVRDELRKRLGFLGFGPLAPATWVCPHPRLDEVANAGAGLPSARLSLLTTRTSGLAADRAMAASCWELDELGASYARFVRSVRSRLSAGLLDHPDPATAMVERVHLVNGYRQIVWRDPQLPVELQPAGWPGDEAHQLFDRVHDALLEGSAHLYDASGSAINA
jgi:phenylacetic acid degradation operon negative regulatory protein